MQVQLENITIEDLPYVERDLDFAQKVSLCFLLFGEQHADAAYILQKLLTLARAPELDQQHSDLLRQYAQTNPNGWRGHLVEALCIINARQTLRKLGLRWSELRLHYLPHIVELTLHIHPLLKALYTICEQLTVVQSGRLVLDITEKLERAQHGQVADVPLRFYDYDQLEIFLLDWLTRRHLRLGDINTVGSDVQLLIEYLKFNDMPSLSRLLVQTINTNQSNQSGSTPNQPVEMPSQPSTAPQSSKMQTDVASEKETEPALLLEQQEQPQANNGRERHPNAIQLSRDHCGIVLIINQRNFHRNVSPELLYLLPEVELGNRIGTDKDKQRLQDVFTLLGYEVEVHDDVEHLTMIEHIRRASARMLTRESLIVCILSHGFEGAVYGTDSIAISISEIQNVLCSGENLQDKPKFLVIQACQQPEQNKHTRIVSATTKSPSQHVNMLVAMSTVPGFVAFRHTLDGSWYIQTLCDMIVRYSATEHLQEILFHVTNEVSTRRGDKGEEMVPMTQSTLRKHVYLPPVHTEAAAEEANTKTT